MHERSMIKYAFIVYVYRYCCLEETLTQKRTNANSVKWFEFFRPRRLQQPRHPHAIIWRLNFPINIHLYTYICLCDVWKVVSVWVHCVSIYFFSDIKYTHFLNWLTAAKHIDRKTNIHTENRVCRARFRGEKTSIEMVCLVTNGEKVSIWVSIVSLCV